MSASSSQLSTPNIPHSSSQSDDSADGGVREADQRIRCMTVVAGELKWTGTYDMQQDINGEITNTDLTGAKVNVDTRDWWMYSILRSGWTTDHEAATWRHTLVGERRPGSGGSSSLVPRVSLLSGLRAIRAPTWSVLGKARVATLNRSPLRFSRTSLRCARVV